MPAPYKYGVRVYSSPEAYADALRFFENEMLLKHSKASAEQPKLASQLWELEHLLASERAEALKQFKARGIKLPEGYKFGEFTHLGKVAKK